MSLEHHMDDEVWDRISRHPVILTGNWQDTPQDDATPQNEAESSWWDHLQIIGEVQRHVHCELIAQCGLPGGGKFNSALSSQAVLLSSQMSMMYKITDTEVRRLATVFLEQPVEVQAHFIEIVTFVGDQFMPGPEHARQIYWQARPERYDLVEDKTEETLRTILTLSLHTILQYGIFNCVGYLKEEWEQGICHIRDSFCSIC